MTNKKRLILFSAFTAISVLSIQATALPLNPEFTLDGSQCSYDLATDSSSTFITNYYNQCNPSLSIRCSKAGIAIPDSLYIVCNTSAMGEFVFPFKGRILSPYGNRRRHHLHTGVDIKLQAGDTVRCAFNGVVRMAKRFHGYGLMVVVQHPNGLETLYAHLSKFLVKPGEEVSAGTPLALGGRTGRATTTHLHFETRFLGEHFDPAYLISYSDFSLREDTLMAYYRNGELAVFPKGSNSNQAELSSNPEVVKPAVQNKVSSYYVVKKGDTLYSIARKNRMALDDLYKLNGIKPGAVLSVGTKLWIK